MRLLVKKIQFTRKKCNTCCELYRTWTFKISSISLALVKKQKIETCVSFQTLHQNSIERTISQIRLDIFFKDSFE